MRRVFRRTGTTGQFTQDYVGSIHTASFSLHGGTLAIAEYLYAVNASSPDDVQRAAGLPGLYKLGAWHHSKKFSDQRVDAQGLSQADPASSAISKQHRGN